MDSSTDHRRLSVLELFAAPYLASSKSNRSSARAELARRGLPYPLYVLGHVLVFGPGFIWNEILFWDEYDLDLSDLILGWGLTCILLGALMALAAVFAGGLFPVSRSRVLQAGGLGLGVGALLITTNWIAARRR